MVKFWKRTATKSASTSANSGVTGSSSGKKETQSRCLEFVKSYSSHNGPLLALVTSQPEGESGCSIGYDNLIKFYDVASFDVSGMIRVDEAYKLGRCAVLLEREDLVLLVSTRGEQRSASDGPTADNVVSPGSILMFSGTTLSSKPSRVIGYHASPVTAMGYHANNSWVVSADVSGVIEVWNVDDLSSTSSSGDNSSSLSLPFQSKLDTDLYALMKKKTYAIDMAISPNHFAIYSSDRKIRLFSFTNNCKLVCIYDERLKVYDNLLASKSSTVGIDAIEYGKRAAVEREMEDAYLLSGAVVVNTTTKKSFSAVTATSEGSHHQSMHMTFDNTGKFLLIPTIVGVKVINIQSHKVVATIGKSDASSLRFLHLCLCPGDAVIDQQMQLARSGGSSAAITHGGNDEPNDSLLIGIAYGKRRFYAFSHHDPLADNPDNEEQIILARDVMNEAPDASDLLEASHMGRNDDTDAAANLTTATKAVLRTTHGDISIKLFPKETPKTISNFIGHAQSGYYDNVIFHRIIPGFMIQTGDPLGDGTGGESIWGGEFEDEIRRELRHGE